MKENPLGITKRHVLLGLYTRECVKDGVLKLENRAISNEALAVQMLQDFKVVHDDIERMKKEGTLPKPV